MSVAKSSLEGIATFVVSSVAQPDPAMMDLAGMEDMKPMALEEIASVFPVAGPFAGTSESSDHFLKEFMEEIQPAFRGKLISILASRFPDSAHPCEEDVRRHCSHEKIRSPLHCLGLHAQHVSPRCREEIRHTVPFGCSEEIHRHCGHGPPAGLLRCLEDVGVHLGFRCADAIIAARQALASIGWSDKHVGKDPRLEAAAPDDGLLDVTSPAVLKTAELQVAGNLGGQTSGHPYICCPKVTRHHYLGGQPIRPKGWQVEEHGHGHCCRKSWTWGCGEHCAFEECKQDLALEWYPVDDKTENYKCCPDMRLIQTPEGEKTDLPNLVTVGSSLVSRPVDLSAVTFTQVLCVAGVLLGAALMCRFALNCWWTFSRQHLHKDQ